MVFFYMLCKAVGTTCLVATTAVCHTVRALQAYDGALVRFKGATAATNFSVSYWDSPTTRHITTRRQLNLWLGCLAYTA